ncbi:MAG: hypothetical protein K2Y40_04675 [Reyranella sp.]|nr:hypothetical protein [Reyranella sp.]
MPVAGKGRVAALAMFALGACTTTTGGPPPGMTAAQGAAYCATLANAYGEYVANVGGYLGGTATGGVPADIDARVAIAQCQDGNTAAAIPVLQQKLRDARVPVPSPPA